MLINKKLNEQIENKKALHGSNCKRIKKSLSSDGMEKALMAEVIRVKKKNGENLKEPNRKKIKALSENLNLFFLILKCF